MANENEDTFTFTAWGDSQGGWDVFSSLIAGMTADSVAFSIGLGDLVSHGAQEEQWLAFVMCLQPLLGKMPVFAVAGNHDYDGYYNDLHPSLYYQYTGREPSEPSYFAWQYGGAYFLALDPNQNFPLAFDDEQIRWMLEHMNSEEWRSANWRFVMLHQPPYSQGWPGYHGDDFVREMVDSLAAPKKIDVVLSAHSHNYERLVKRYGDHETQFFVLGGAGGGLEPPESSEYPQMDRVIKAHHYARFEVSSERIKMTIRGLDGEILDRIELTVQP